MRNSLVAVAVQEIQEEAWPDRHPENLFSGEWSAVVCSKELRIGISRSGVLSFWKSVKRYMRPKYLSKKARSLSMTRSLIDSRLPSTYARKSQVDLHFPLRRTQHIFSGVLQIHMPSINGTLSRSTLVTFSALLRKTRQISSQLTGCSSCFQQS